MNKQKPFEGKWSAYTVKIRDSTRKKIDKLEAELLLFDDIKIQRRELVQALFSYCFLHLDEFKKWLVKGV